MKFNNILKYFLILSIIIGLLFMIATPRFYTSEKDISKIMLSVKERVEQGDLSRANSLFLYYLDTNKTKECVNLYKSLLKKGQKNKLIEIANKMKSFNKHIAPYSAKSFCNP